MGQTFREPSPPPPSSPSPHTLTWHSGTQRPICLLFITAPNWHRGPGPEIDLALLPALLPLPAGPGGDRAAGLAPGEGGGEQGGPSERPSLRHPTPLPSEQSWWLLAATARPVCLQLSTPYSPLEIQHLVLVRGCRAECILWASLSYGP